MKKFWIGICLVLLLAAVVGASQVKEAKPGINSVPDEVLETALPNGLTVGEYLDSGAEFVLWNKEGLVAVGMAANGLFVGFDMNNTLTYGWYNNRMFSGVKAGSPLMGRYNNGRAHGRFLSMPVRGLYWTH